MIYGIGDDLNFDVLNFDWSYTELLDHTVLRRSKSALSFMQRCYDSRSLLTHGQWLPLLVHRGLSLDHGCSGS